MVIKYSPVWVITKGPEQSRVPEKTLLMKPWKRWVIPVMIVVRGKRDWMKEHLNEWNRCSVKNRSGAECGKIGV